MAASLVGQDALSTISFLDESLSERTIGLDPLGYFIIRLDQKAMEIVVEHYENDIDDLGRAIDKETGEPIGCRGEKKRSPVKVYKGCSAKEVGIKLTEGDSPHPLSRLDHALYLGRELQKAEACLLHNKPYIQD